MEEYVTDHMEPTVFREANISAASQAVHCTLRN